MIMKAKTKNLNWKELAYLIFDQPDAETTEILLQNGQKICLKRCFVGPGDRIQYDAVYRGRKISCLGERNLFSVILDILEKTGTQKIMFYSTYEDQVRYPVEIRFIPEKEL